MEMQIPQLRQLFEARVGQIASVLSKDPPPELGSVDPALRGLKGFLLALEGMLRNNDLRGLPFTARQELFDRVERASEAIRALPSPLNREQALDVMRAMDSLHRLCLQENLMASGLDASKLGKITVILERKLGEVLETIDGIAAAGNQRVSQLEQATQDCLAEIQGTYEKEAAVLGNGASQAVESIRSQTEMIRKRQAEALEDIDKLPHEITQKRLHCQGQLDRQLAAAQRVVTEVQDEQVAIHELFVEVRGQLASARTAIEEMTEIAQAAADARDDLRAKLAEGQDVVGSIGGLLTAGTQGARDAEAKVAEAGQHLASIQQTALRCTKLADAARDQQDQAVAAVQATAQAVERMSIEARQTLDEQIQTAAGVLAGIESHGQAAAETLEQVQQRRELADQAGQAVAEARQAAGQTLRQASEDLTQLHDLLDQGVQMAEQLNAFVQTGGELTGRMDQALAEADQSHERIAQLEGQAAEATDAVRQRSEEALEAGREAVAHAQRQQSQFELSVSQHREAARDAVASLRSDEAIAADLLKRTQQDIETLQAEMKQIHGIRTTASDAQGDLREKLAQASSIVEKLGQVLAEVGELKTQVVAHLADSAGARARLDRLEADAVASAEDLARRQAQALEAVRGEADALAEQRTAREASFTEQRAAFEASLAEQREAYDASLAEQREAYEASLAEQRAAHAASLAEQREAQAASLTRARSVQATLLAEQRETQQASLAEQVESARAAVTDLHAYRESADKLLEQTRQQAAAVAAEQREACAASLAEQRAAHDAALAEQLETARATAADLRARKETADELLEQARHHRDAAQAAEHAAAEARAATAQATGEVQAKLHEARTAAADLAGLQSAGAESRAKIEAELAAAASAAGQVGDVRRDLDKLLATARQHEQEMAQAREQSQQFLAALQGDGQEALEGLEQQTADLVARAERLQHEVEDLLGAAADGGLFKQFDHLAEQSGPRLRKWMRLLIGGGGGGAVVLAAASAIIAASWPWAGIAVLTAGLVPLAIFLYFCTSQYNAERQAETKNHYRAALGRSLAAYRKLLAAMKAEGLADSAHVDRLLAALFGPDADADESLPATPIPVTVAEPDDAKDQAEQDRT